MRRRLLYSTRTRRAREDELWRGEWRMNSTQPRCSLLTDTDAGVRDDHEQSITVEASCTQTTLRHLDQQHDASYWQLRLTKYHTMRNVQHRLRSCLFWAAPKTLLLGASWLRRNTIVWLSASQNILSLLNYFTVQRQHRSQCKTRCVLAKLWCGYHCWELFSLIHIRQLMPARTCRQSNCAPLKSSSS